MRRRHTRTLRAIALKASNVGREPGGLSRRGAESALLDVAVKPVHAILEGAQGISSKDGREGLLPGVLRVLEEVDPSRVPTASARLRKLILSRLATCTRMLAVPRSHGKPQGCVLERNGGGPFDSYLSFGHVAHGGPPVTASIKPCTIAV